MVFSSITFLFFFLPAVLWLYYLVPRSARNAVLVLASLVFYTWGTGALVVVLIASIAANYLFGLGIERAVERGDQRRALLIVAVGAVMNLGLLAWFKYATFLFAKLSGILGLLGAPGAPGDGHPAADRHLLLYLTGKGPSRARVPSRMP